MSREPAFRFLDLPIELRLMVYETIPIVTHHLTVPEPPGGGEKYPYGRITLVTKSYSTTILATCQLIHEEAKVVFQPRLGRLRRDPVRFIIASNGARSFYIMKDVVRNVHHKVRDIVENHAEETPHLYQFISAIRYKGFNHFDILEKLYRKAATYKFSSMARAFTISFTVPVDELREYGLGNSPALSRALQVLILPTSSESACPIGATLTPVAGEVPKDIAEDFVQLHEDLQTCGTTFGKGATYIRQHQTSEEIWDREWRAGEKT
ncbi:hypothetical protein CC86DRAFT_421839 [Ophiobolus disseminans]|uniref:Uncharacterized protein n=1 Tax=Ophiobolus disseminans TaxID=1469910 RepID=A0A6A6ZUD1_9PLEO|nr:hypothetical protein CC86DRAFT_421839 [Ophiobolus disseminans]